MPQQRSEHPWDPKHPKRGERSQNERASAARQPRPCKPFFISWHLFLAALWCSLLKPKASALGWEGVRALLQLTLAADPHRRQISGGERKPSLAASSRGERQIPIPSSPSVLSHRAPCQLGLVKAPVGSQR